MVKQVAAAGRIVAGILVVMALVAGCAKLTRGAAPPSSPAVAISTTPSTGLAQIRDPLEVTGNYLPPGCTAGLKGQLPDPKCTPGSVDPVVTQANIGSTICTSGYTSRDLRPPASQTEHFKYAVAYPAYGIPSQTTSELDHLVPLELGGSNDASNLWPEVGPLPNPKDEVERALNQAVCAPGSHVSLAAAQAAIASDWITAESRLGISTAP